MLTVKFSERSNYALIPPLALRGAWDTPAVVAHVFKHLKPRDRKDFAIDRALRSRTGRVVLRKGKAEIPFEIEGSLATPSVPAPHPAEIVPPRWSR